MTTRRETPLEALRRVNAAAIANGAPSIVEQPAPHVLTDRAEAEARAFKTGAGAYAAGVPLDAKSPQGDAAALAWRAGWLDAARVALPWLVTDEEAHPLILGLQRFASEDEAAAWIGAQPDAAKVYRGGYGLTGPAEDEDEDGR